MHSFQGDDNTKTISILNQHIDDEDGVYRIQYGDKVVSITIPTDVFDEDTMCRPYLLIPKLPSIFQGAWTRARITRAATNELEVTTSTDQLPSIESVWHPEQIDVLSLKHVKYHRSGVHQVHYDGGKVVVAKTAQFDWDIPRLESETRVYHMLDQYERQNPNKCRITPRVLGHLTEGGRVMGILLEKLEGRFASIDDLTACEEVLRKFHAVGLIHGDVNRYNFIVDDSDGSVKIIDFEHAEDFDDAGAKSELESLTSQLSEETGRGGPPIVTSE
ncbi:hypothetical protein LTR37_020766 [Vermiconidia calcicola]|uniref:Uncharacterized protein n=1 Tax=Vermiconidia calcicola TaxID=1690605 RepID=A0ACC3MBT2_9PEZI|nr:hypothetical protein LTR37_020766 [Vermiconidia calcicola]